MSYKRILYLSDQHIPYHHPDTLAFLSRIKDKLDPDLVVNIGDELDKHALSFHSSDADLPSAGDELEKSIEKLRYFYKLFPSMELVDSNHGSMVYRKAKHYGIPLKYIKSYKDTLDAPNGWNWHHDFTYKMGNNQLVYNHHGKNSDVTKLSKNMSVCAVQGHYHSKFKIEYWANPGGLFWAMQIGCLIDDKSMAFAYNKTTMDRPIIGTGIVVNGIPQLVPMILGENGRWIGRLSYV